MIEIEYSYLLHHWPFTTYNSSNANDVLINKISDVVRAYPIKSNSEIVICTNLVEAIRALNNARQQRIHMSYSALNGDIWTVILIGTFLVLAVNFLFAMNYWLHVLVISGASLMAASMIFLLVTLDRPFQGEFVIEPDAFKAMLQFFTKYPDNSNMMKPQPAVKR